MNRIDPVMAIVEANNKTGLREEQPTSTASLPAGYDSFAIPQQERATVKSLLSALLRYKWLILLISLLTFLLATSVAYQMEPVYRSATTLRIMPDSAKVLNYGVEVEGRYKPEPGKDFYKAEFKLLQSRTVIERTIDDLQLEDELLKKSDKESVITQALGEIKLRAFELMGKPIDDNTTVETTAKDKPIAVPASVILKEKITTIPSKDWGLVDVVVDWKNPEGAAEIANNLADNFIEMTRERRLALAKETRESLNKQIALTKAKLLDSERKLVEYAKKNKVFRVDAQESLTAKDLGTLSAAHAEAQRQRILAESTYREQLESAANIRTLDNKVIESLKVELSSLQKQYQDKLVTYKPQYPAMIEIRKQINKTQSQLNTELTNVKKSVKADLRSKYVTSQKSEQKLKSELERGKRNLIQLQDKNIGYNNLLREVETNKTIYEGLLQRVKEVAVAEDLGTSNISVLEPAYVPHRKHKPSIPVIMGLGLLSGLLIGSILALQLNANDNKVRTVEDLGKLSQLPVLGIFPLIKNTRQLLLLSRHHDQSVAEAFQSLRTKLSFFDAKGMPKIIHVTSAQPNEGKTYTAINLATVIEKTGKSVLLIDADMRIPSIHRYLNAKNDRGLAELLSGELKVMNALKRIGQTDLLFIPAGKIEGKPADLLSSQRMINLLKWAASEFDHVIIDSPPVLSLADSLILSNRANGTLFVVNSNKTDKKMIVDALSNLELSYANVIGFVLNRAGVKAQGHYSYEKYTRYSNSTRLART